MEKFNKKELLAQYKERERTGGVFLIKCTESKKMWIKSAKDLESAKKRFEFSLFTDTPLQPSMAEDWKSYGAKSFKFEVLEEINKKETWTEKDFEDEIDFALSAWEEKLGVEG